MNTIEYTATQKNNRECTHDQFYGQFVNPSIICLVSSRIGNVKIKASTDPHFNDIPLVQWDNLSDCVRRLIDDAKWKRLFNTTYGESDKDKFVWSLSNGVCIAKQAARMIKEGTQP